MIPDYTCVYVYLLVSHLFYVYYNLLQFCGIVCDYGIRYNPSSFVLHIGANVVRAGWMPSLSAPDNNEYKHTLI